MRFLLKDDHGASASRTRVVYSGSVPDLFRTGRQIVVEGTLRNGTFVAKPGSLVTKCPSKYTPAKSKA
jgi:cytochrome c-type biogenesis protein CcmE